MWFDFFSDSVRRGRSLPEGFDADVGGGVVFEVDCGGGGGEVEVGIVVVILTGEGRVAVWKER